MAECGVYKGRKYKLLWKGKTKFGTRAHLAFWDGSKDFWVDGGLVTVAESNANGYRGGDGDDCPCNRGGECRCGSDAPCCMCG